MTHFMRYAALGTMVAGLSLCAVAQDDDLDALLSGLAENPTAGAVTPPAEESEKAEETVLPAEEDETSSEKTEEIDTPSEEAEMPAEETVSSEAEEPAAVAEPAVEADEPAATEMPAEETASSEAETPATETESATEADESVAPETSAEETASSEAETPATETEPAEEAAKTNEKGVVPPKGDSNSSNGNGSVIKPESAPEPAPVPAPEPVGIIPPTPDPVLLISEEDKMLNELTELEKTRQDGIEKYGMSCLKAAKDLLTTKPAAGKAEEQYVEAQRLYGKAREAFEHLNRDSLLPLREECEKGELEAKYRQANELFRQARMLPRDVASHAQREKGLLKAKDLALEVQKSGHAFGQRLVKEIDKELNKPVEVVQNPTLPRYAEDEFKTKRMDIDTRMRRATTYYHVGDYTAARQQIELILREDPENESAINLYARIGRRAAARSNQLKLATHDTMIDQVNDNWTPRGYLGSDSEELYAPKISKGAKTVVDDKGKQEVQKIIDKLNYIKLPEFNVRPPSTLADVVELFSQMSREYDKPDLSPEEKGVSFVLNIQDGVAPATSNTDEDAFADDSSAPSSSLPPIHNISMTWVTLKDALDMVCDVTKTKYIVKKNTVMIVKDGYVDGKMETRSYNVMSSFSDKVTQMTSELSSATSGSDSWSTAGSTSDSGDAAGSDTWKTLFINLGVPFEGKASIIYLASVGKLRVTNTPENLALFESILEELNVTPYQIEVEARFVEVSQADLNSLGFEWQLNQNITGTIGSGIDWADSAIRGNSNGGTSAGGMGSDGRPVFRASNASGTGKNNVAMHGGQLNQGMRFLGDGATYPNRVNLSDSAIAPNDTFASFSAVFGKVDMTMILHMLAQRTDTDMLSSPKVLARPGQEALIRVVTEWIYPTEFDITELEESDTNYNNGSSTASISTGSNITAPPVKFAVEPQSFEKQDVGVTLQVVPEVSQEGQMINLLVNPKVVEYLEDFDYGMDVPYIQYTMNELGITTGAEVAYYRVKMPQPKFHFREISTYLSVYNGSTIVMGGLITEKRKAFEDKIPLLGDLPFIGFLFRSKGEYSEKRNLLVFLTARLVDPSGRPLKTATDGRTGTAAMDSSAASDTSTMGTADTVKNN